LTKVRYDAGAGSPIDVASAQARLNATEAVIPALITAEKRANYRLCVLTESGRARWTRPWSPPPPRSRR
jgi:multidrug efflux system outer membrane protein